MNNMIDLIPLAVEDRKQILKERGLEYYDLKLLAGEKHGDIRPMEFYYDPNELQTQDSKLTMPLGRRYYMIMLELDGANIPAVELGGDPVHPVFRPNINIMPGPAVDKVADLDVSIPLDDNSVGILFSRFLAEHIKYVNFGNFLAENYRVVATGGMALHLVPNLMAMCRALADTKEWPTEASYLVFGGHPNFPSNYHHTGLSPELAVRLFKSAGFSSVAVWEYPIFDLEMIIEAWK